MAHTPADTEERLISLATAALMEAELDAAKNPGKLIFRPEWRPTPRYRRAGTGEDYLTWFPFVMNKLSEAGLQLDQLPIQPLPAEPAPSYAFAPPPSPPPPPPPPPRTASIITSPSPLKSPPQLQENAVEKLVEQNRNAFDKIINHPFPITLGRGTASLDGFRYYMIQDKMYLETCALLKAIRLNTGVDFKREEIKRLQDGLQSSADAIRKLEETCTDMLGIHGSDVENTPACADLEKTKQFYKDSIKALPDDAKLLGYYIVLLPCVLSYFSIANRLVTDQSTLKNVVYHPAWTVVNDDESSVGKYSKFINENIAAKRGVKFADWSSMFKAACQSEVRIFNTGLRAPAPFQIIPEGSYFIRIHSPGTVVLAVRNLKELSQGRLDKRLRGYFPDNAGPLFVMGVKKIGDSDKWHIVATKDGYTFQNLGTHLYLGISSNEFGKKARILKAVNKPHYWWINPLPSKSQPKKGSLLYQIYDSQNLQYTLHADSEVLRRAGPTKFPCIPIVVNVRAENCEAPCQTWLFDNQDRTEDQSAIPTQDQEMTNAELGELKAQEMFAELEAQKATYLQHIELLRQQPENLKTRSVNLDAQNQLLEKHANGVKALWKEMGELISENLRMQYCPTDISILLAD